MTELTNSLRALLGDAAVVDDAHLGSYSKDATELRGLIGTADEVVLPADVDQVAELVAWCYERDIPMVPRGGGTGFAGGAVPVTGGVVVGMERMQRVVAFDAEQWRMHVEAGVTTARIHDVARASGLMYPVDPGAGEVSQIGGNMACNAGGPRSFKYGVTGAWVMGLEAVVAGGERITAGGPLRKDVAGYDVRSLFVGSEGTLGIITSAWLRLVPAPEAVAFLYAVYPSVGIGAERALDVYRSGLQPAALEYFDAGALRNVTATFPGELPEDAGFLVIVEIDGSEHQVAEMTGWLTDTFTPDSTTLGAISGRADEAAFRRWRGGVSYGVAAQRGGKVSEDIVVPVEHLAAAIEMVVDVGTRFGLPACSWGHAGDANLHATFMIDPASVEDVNKAHEAAQELFARALEMGGSVSGEHGLGWVKRDQFAERFSPAEVELQRRIEHAFDPKDLFNPGKKLPT